MRTRRAVFGSSLLVAVLGIGAPAGAQYFGKNKIQYRDFDWKIYHSPHFDVFYYPESEGRLQTVVSFAESAYDVLSRRFDYQIKEPTPLIFYATHSAFEQNNIILNFIPEGIGAFASPVRNRMVMPVDIPDPELLELIAHELTHIFQYHIFFQGRLSRALTTNPPQWLMEGMASYMAEDEGPREKMFLRDAVVNDAIPRITERGTSGFFAYRFGHAVFDFMEERWGEDGFRDFVYEYRNAFGAKVDKAIERAFRIKPEDFDVEFRRWLRRQYLPQLVETGEPLDFGRPFRGKDRDADVQPLATSAASSPSGDLVAAIFYGGDDVEVVLYDTRERQLVRSLTKGLSNEYQYVVAQELTMGRKMGSDLAFSPDGNTVAVFAKRERGRSLLLLDVLKGGIRRIVETPDIEQQIGLSWHPDGKRIAFAGHRAGRFDIFELDLESGTTTNLTDDDIFDGGPAYLPDGSGIVFTSFAGRYGKLYRRALGPIGSTTSAERVALTSGEWNDYDPAVSPDGRTLYFTSDRGNAQNIWSLRLDSAGTAAPNQITNAITAGYQPAVLPRTDGQETLVFTGYWKGRFDLYLVEDSILDAARGPQPHSPAAQGEPTTAEPAVAVPGPDTGATVEAEPPAPAAADSALPKFEPDIQVTIDEENKEDYRGFRLFLEDAGYAVGVNSDQTFVADTYLSFSDYLGDRRLIARFSSIETFSNFDVGYFNLKNRLQWGLRVYDDRTFFIAQDLSTGRLIRDRAAYTETGVEAALAYPFNVYHRLETGIGYKLREIEFQSFAFTDEGFVPVVLPRDDDFPELTLALVGDTVRFGDAGPLSGRRYRLSGSYAPDFDKDETIRLDGQVSSTLTSTMQLDLRQYIRVSRRSNLALRAVASASYGNFPQPLYFGGLDTLRGTDFRDLVGDRAFFVNLEYRFPLFDYLVGPFLNFRGVRGRVFLDVGGAYFDYAGQEFDFWDSDRRLVDGVSSYGWGFTINFGGLDLNWDFAKRWDFKESLEDGFETSFWIGTQF